MKTHDLDSMDRLTAIQNDMRALYDEVRVGKTDLKVADTLANIAGKGLKAEQLKLAREIFVNEKARLLPPAE